MRLRVLALPKQTLGAASTQPFLLVFDRCTATQCEYLRYSDMKEALGAAGVVTFVDEVDLDERQMCEIDETTVAALRVALAGF